MQHNPAIVSSVRKTEPFSTDGPIINTRGGAVQAKKMKFYSIFGGVMYDVTLYIVKDRIPILLPHAGLDRMKLWDRTINRESDGLSVVVQWRGKFPS